MSGARPKYALTLGRPCKAPQIAGTKTTVKATKQVKEEKFFISMKNYTGIESEREVEEFIIHPNTFKNLKVGECVIIGKYPSPWNKKIRIPPPEEIQIDKAICEGKLQELLKNKKGDTTLTPLDLRSLTKATFSKIISTRPGEEVSAKAPQQHEGSSSSADPNF